jgi:UDP-N-acetylglucosamine--N-acetylmuramyl-(pentapeptide) pyrophosphoryl-undecaprenol N-acetylglucosamine transferase
MTSSPGHPFNVAIACGGTGGHLFPGLAVAAQLVARGTTVTLMISSKEIDRLAIQAAQGMNIVTLPAVGLSRGHLLAFLHGFRESSKVARRSFSQRRPQAVLAMGGFTSAPPLLAAKRFKAPTFLHESNTIPGRANRWLSWIVERAFVGFPSAADLLHTRQVTVTGTPVRADFEQLDSNTCRAALGLDPSRPVALVMGGSQGANGINELVIRSLPLLAEAGRDWQWLHLAGTTGVEKLKRAYSALGLVASVHSFFMKMHLAMGAATAAISRAGASSLAELAAVRLPAVLIPFPAATDNHQFHNARAFEQTGAARLLDQQTARPEDLTRAFGQLMSGEIARQQMQASLANWHKPGAANAIAQAILDAAGMRSDSLRTGPPENDETQPNDRLPLRSTHPERPKSRISHEPTLGAQASRWRVLLSETPHSARPVAFPGNMPVGASVKFFRALDQPDLTERIDA